ncbi:MAG TPA: recombination protein RecR, partial [Gammaproteobacteria bacterium]|nr:recombination protein RecR [Gammaproteobacteria bacterium]
CALCASPRRNAAQLCVVETPADLVAVEQSGAYKGMYFVLMGHLSPLDGIGPDEMGVQKLQRLLESESIDEVILATNLTAEGQATADFLGELIRDLKVPVTRLARGLPIGGELEYLDHGTVTQAFEDRKFIV